MVENEAKEEGGEGCAESERKEAVDGACRVERRGHSRGRWGTIRG